MNEWHQLTSHSSNTQGASPSALPVHNHCHPNTTLVAFGLISSNVDLPRTHITRDTTDIHHIKQSEWEWECRAGGRAPHQTHTHTQRALTSTINICNLVSHR